MAKEDIGRKLNELRRLVGSGDVANVAARLRPLLQADFAFWFRTLKEQKLVSRLRSVPRIRELRLLLLTPDFRLMLLTPQFSALAHHFDVCEFFQEVFAQIDAEAAALPSSLAHPENVARAVVRMMEIANYAHQRNAMARARDVPQRITALEVSQIERRLRDILDAGNIILNSPVAGSGVDRRHSIGNAELGELVRLALLYDEMRQALDVYTFRGSEVRINRRSLVVGRADRETALAAAVGAERSADYDQVRFALLTTFEARLHDECSSIPVGASDTFFDFLRKVDGGKAGEEARGFGRALAKDFEFELAGFFEVTTEVAAKAGAFSISELIRAWAFLVTVAVLGQEWNARRAELVVSAARAAPSNGRNTEAVVRDVPVPELRGGLLARMLAHEAGFSIGQSRGLVEQFASRPGRGRIDLFYKPLLLLSDDVVLLPTPYIRKSRFDRNLFALVATETELDQKKKGYLPVVKLNQSFREAGFHSLVNFRVRIDHRELTDIDLVAFKDEILFLGQCKILIEPDSFYDAWKAEQKLQVAAEQLNTCLAHFDEVRAAVFERLDLKGYREERVMPFIVTNTRQFTERTFCGHPVVDVPYLNFILGGARRSIVGTSSGGIGIGEGRSYIKGDKPTAEELAELLTRTFHKVQEREIISGHVMRKIGNRKVHLPTVSMRTAGESYLLITDEEIFEKHPAAERGIRIT